MITGDLDDLFLRPDPSTANTYRWATIRQIEPLRIRFDGDTADLATSPDSLVDPQSLVVGSRVWCQLYGRRVVILGAGGGAGPAVPQIRSGRVQLTPVPNTATFTYVEFDTPFEPGTEYAVSVTSRTTAATVQNAIYRDDTEEGVYVGVVRTNNTSTTLAWIAVSFT